jgi:hypothetical protein
MSYGRHFAVSSAADWGIASNAQITQYRVTTQIPPPGTLAVASTTDCEA